MAKKLVILKEAPLKITKVVVDALWRRRAVGQRITVRDAACRGLALIVHAESMSWTFSYKPRGIDSRTGKRFPTQAVTLGNPTTHSPDDARAAANLLKGQVKAGGDPATIRKKQIDEDAIRRTHTTDRMLDEYIKIIPSRPKLRGHGVKSPKHAKEEEAHAKAAVLAMKVGAKPIGDIKAADIRALLRADPSHPNAARHRFGAISRFFDWLVDEGILSSNPCALISKDRRPKAPASRANFLSAQEIGWLWRAVEQAEGLETVYRDLIQFLLSMPCRRGEATHLEWQHLDLDACIWDQPSHVTKNGDAHRLHLHPIAITVLRRRHEAAGKPKTGLVFPGPRSAKAIDTFTKIKGKVIKAAPDLPEWWIHDMRRSFVSVLAEHGIPEAIADAMLNHRQAATRGGVLGVYQRASRWPEQVRAMNLWGNILADAIKVPSAGGADVINFTGRRA